MLTSRPAIRGEAQPVLGPVPAERLGVTMVHEHLLHDASCLYAEPSGHSEWVLRKGMTDEQLHAILVDNPACVLPLVEAD